MKLTDDEMRALLVQAAEQLCMYQGGGYKKRSKKVYEQTDALVGRLLRAAIDTIDEEESITPA